MLRIYMPTAAAKPIKEAAAHATAALPVLQVEGILWRDFGLSL